MATAGPRYPGTTASEVGPSGDNDWISTSPISADDGSEAQITAATYDAGDHSYRLQATNFGFDADIPAGSTINGITVEIDRRCFAGAAQDQEVRLYDSTGTLVGDDKQTATAWPATLGIATYGGAADTWTSGLDAADIRSAGFGVALIVLADAANTDIGVDFIRVTVDYTAPSPSGTAAITLPSATVSGTGAQTFTGTSAVSLPVVTTSAVGEEVLTATSAVSLAAATVAGTGDHGAAAAPSGTSAITLPAMTVSATGELGLSATSAVALPVITTSATGVLTISGTSAITVAAPTFDSTAWTTAVGTSAIALPAVTVAASGTGGESDIALAGGYTRRRYVTPEPPKVVITGTGAIYASSPLVAGMGHAFENEDWLFGLSDEALLGLI